MRKIVVMALVLITMLACKKETMVTPPNATLPELSSGSLLEYEYYTPVGDLEDEIREALNALDVHDSLLGYTEINRGIWLLETGISYLIPDSNYVYEDFSADTNTYTIALNTEGLMSEKELRTALSSLHGSLTATCIESTRHVATDIKVSEINSTNIVLVAHSTLLTGVGVAGGIDCNTNYGPPFNTISKNQEAKNKEYCAGSSGSSPVTPRTAASECAKEPRDALRCLTASQNRFYTQVITYGSTNQGFGTHAPFSADNLLGHQNAPFQNHQTWVAVNACVFANQLNTYSHVIYDDIKGLMGKYSNFISLKMSYSLQQNPFPNVNDCKFEYDGIGLGKTITPQINSISLSYI